MPRPSAGQRGNWDTAISHVGEKAGIFAPGDHMFTAEMMQSATMKFSLPQLFTSLTLPKLERELDGVLNLLLKGVYARGDETPAKATGRTMAEANH